MMKLRKLLSVDDDGDCITDIGVEGHAIASEHDTIFCLIARDDIRPDSKLLDVTEKCVHRVES